MTRPIIYALSAVLLKIVFSYATAGASAERVFTNIDKVKITFELYNQFYVMELFPDVVMEDIDSFTINAVTQILGQEAFEKDENSEAIVAQVASVIRERLELLRDPRQVKDMELAPRNDLLFLINVTSLANNNRTIENQDYE